MCFILFPRKVSFALRKRSSGICRHMVLVNSSLLQAKAELTKYTWEGLGWEMT